MAWNRQHIQTMIGMMGYEQDPKNEHIWKQTVNGKVYGVDFKKEEPFVFIGSERYTEFQDEPFKALKEAIEYASVESSERREAEADPSTTKEKPETPANNPETPKEDKPVETPKPAPEQPKPESKPAKSSLLDMIHGYVGNDVLEAFGDTGSGKSKFALTIAKDAIKAGKKVYYLDTERNLTEADIASLKGCEYKYTPVIEEIDKLVQKLPAVDVVIIDSIGFPVLTSYARLSMKQKGDALLKLIAIFGDLKKWAYLNNGIAIVTNQPESEFNKPAGYVRDPFGDKSQYAAKEIWWLEPTSHTPEATTSNITAYRSRSVGRGTKIASMTITNQGVEVV